jgi:hypothetical protein
MASRPLPGPRARARAAARARARARAAARRARPRSRGERRRVTGALPPTPAGARAAAGEPAPAGARAAAGEPAPADARAAAGEPVRAAAGAAAKAAGAGEAAAGEAARPPRSIVDEQGARHCSNLLACPGPKTAKTMASSLYYITTNQLTKKLRKGGPPSAKGLLCIVDDGV